MSIRTPYLILHRQKTTTTWKKRETASPIHVKLDMLYLARLTELELIDRERRLVERRIKQASSLSGFGRMR